MKKYITTIKLLGSDGNCYLIKTLTGFILVVTGEKSSPQKLESELEALGCVAHNLNLIIFTHCNTSVCEKYEIVGKKFNTKMAIHVVNKTVDFESSSSNLKIKDFLRTILTLNKTSKFIPDLIIDEGYNLSDYGLNARVIYMPGFSNSSIGILTENGELFCDDIFIHDIPQSNEKANLNIVRTLKNLFIDIVYPGQGEPISLSAFEI